MRVSVRPPRLICSSSQPLVQWRDGIKVNLTIVGQWRYFSAFQCPQGRTLPSSTNGLHHSHDVCIMFKDGVIESFVGLLRSHDGVHFDHSYRVLLNTTWEHARTRRVPVLRASAFAIELIAQARLAAATRALSSAPLAVRSSTRY